MTATLNTTPELQHVAMSDLALETNIRLDTKLDDDFVQSIAENGILMPLLGVRDLTGHILIRDGQRRFLAAHRAGLDTVPVFVLTDDTEGEAREARRIAQQVLTTKRAQLNAAEVAAAVDQMSMFGIPADQIAARTGIARATVDAAIATQGNETARASVEAEQLTIEQAATLAQYDGDDNARERLLRAARHGNFAHEAARIAQAVEDAAKWEAAAAPYIEQGIHVLRKRPYSQYASGVVDHHDYDSGTTTKLHPIANFRTKDGDPVSATAITPELLWVHLEEVERYQHDGAPVGEDDVDWDYQAGKTDEDGQPITLGEGLIDPATVERVYQWQIGAAYTSDPKADKLRKQTAERNPVDEKAAAAARHERKRLIALNKAAEAAQGPRREFIAALAKRKTPPKGAARFIMETAVRDGNGMGDHSARANAAMRLGTKTTWALSSALAKASDQRAQVVALILAISAFERRYHKGVWRNKDADFNRYLTFLASIGYELSEVETVITGTRTADQAFAAITAAAEGASEK